MGDISEFSFKYRLFLKTYFWQRIDLVPWTPLKKPLKNSRLLLVTTAGFTTPSQTPFDDFFLSSNTSIREIPDDVDVSNLIENHRSDAFDHTGIRQDPNLAFPLDRMRELSEDGRIGSLNYRHLSLMGSITAPGRLIKKTITPIVPGLVEDRIDIALIIPV